MTKKKLLNLVKKNTDNIDTDISNTNIININNTIDYINTNNVIDINNSIDVTEKPSTYTIGSFDIGVRNLAVCILDKTDENPGYRIREWKLISLVSQVGKKVLTCSSLIKKRKNDIPYCCGKKASFWNPIDKKIAYCRTHVPKDEIDTLQRYTTTKNITDMELNESIINELDEISSLWLECDEIVMESQKRSNMRRIVYMIFSYLTYKKIHQENTKLKNIKIISASHKLAIPQNKLSITLPTISQDGQTKKDYDGRKVLAKEHCVILLKNDHKHLTYYKSQSKKDDLADCFLQGLWYILCKV